MTGPNSAKPNMPGSTDRSTSKASLSGPGSEWWLGWRRLLTAVSQEPMVRIEWLVLLDRRIRLVSIIWAMLMLAWIPIDVLILPQEQGLLLGALRFSAAVAYGLIARWTPWGADDPVAGSWTSHLSQLGRLLLLFGLQTGFLILAVALIGWDGVAGATPVGPALGGGTPAAAVSDWAMIALQAAYVDQPLLMAAAIGLFPLFIVQSSVLAVLVLCGAAVLQLMLPSAGAIGTLWLVAVVAGVGALSALLQAGLLINLVATATRDRLTQVLSRRAGDELGLSEINRSRRHHLSCAVAFLDLDRFKAVNDGWGHDAGDRVLTDVAAHLRDGVRRQDSVIRWGGEEFVLLLPMTDKEAARLLLDRLCRDGLARRPDGARQTVSVGIADLQEDNVTTWAELVTLADRRMYMAKQAGRNRIVVEDVPVAPPMAAALSG